MIAALIEKRIIIPILRLVEGAENTFTNAKSAAEVLDAQHLADVAYNAAKQAARLAKAKKAHDDLIAAVHRARADALTIDARKAEAALREKSFADVADEWLETRKGGGAKTYARDQRMVGYLKDDDHIVPRQARSRCRGNCTRSRATANTCSRDGAAPARSARRR